MIHFHKNLKRKKIRVISDKLFLSFYFFIISISLFSQSTFDRIINPSTIEYRNIPENQMEDYEFIFGCEKHDTIYNLNSSTNLDTISFTFRNKKTKEIINLISFVGNIGGGTLETEFSINSKYEYKKQLLESILALCYVKPTRRKIYLSGFRFKYKNEYFLLENQFVKYIYSTAREIIEPRFETESERYASTKKYKIYNYPFLKNQICNNCNIDTILVPKYNLEIPVENKNDTNQFDTLILKRLQCGLYHSLDGMLFYNNYNNISEEDGYCSGLHYIQSIFDIILDSNKEYRLQEKIIEEVFDTNSFKALNKYYFFDKNHIYYFDKNDFYVLLNVDKNSFSVLGNTAYAKDKNGLRYGEHLFENVNIKNIILFSYPKLYIENILYDGENFYENDTKYTCDYFRDSDYQSIIKNPKPQNWISINDKLKK